MFAPVASLLFSFIATSPQTGIEHGAFVAVGPANADVLALQKDLDDLAQQRFGEGAIVASLLGARIALAEESTQAAVSELEIILSACRDAYFRDDESKARALLARAHGILSSRQGGYLEQRLDLALWGGAVALSLGYRRRAEALAREVFLLSPDYTLDANLFRPSVVQFFAAARAGKAQGPKLVGMRCQHLPENAHLRVDGKTAAQYFALPAGEHLARIEAPGMQPLELKFVAKEGGEIDASSLVALPASLQAALSTAYASVDADPRVRQQLMTQIGALATQANVQSLYFVEAKARAEGKARVVTWREGALFLSEPMDIANGILLALQAWLNSIESSGNRSGTQDPVVESLWGLSVQVNLVSALRSRRLDGLSRAFLSSDLFGMGPEVNIEFLNAWFVSSFNIAGRYYSGPTTILGFAEANRPTLRAGWLLESTFALGARYRFFESSWLALILRGNWQQRRLKDVTRMDRGLAQSDYTRLALGPGMRFHFVQGQTMSFDAQLGYDLWSRWRESPRGTSGRKPAHRPGVFWSMQIKLRNLADITLGYAGVLQGVAFEGSGKGFFSNSSEDLMITEVEHRFVVGKAF